MTTASTPAAVAAKPEPTDLLGAVEATQEPQYIVLYGIGKIPRHQFHWIDNTRFQGGVALHVSESSIKAWKASKVGKMPLIKLLPDMPEAQVDAKYNIPDDVYQAVLAQAGIVTQSTVKTAAVLRSTDIDALVKELGEDGAYQLYEQLGRRVKRRPKNG